MFVGWLVPFLVAGFTGTIGPIPGDSCDTAVSVPCPGTTVIQATTVGAANDLDDEPEEFCLPFGGSGPDLFYEICVPNGWVIHTLIVPETHWDPALWLVVDCNDRLTCLEGSDFGVLGDPEQVSWVNTTGDEVCLHVVADSWTASASGEFLLEIDCSCGISAEAVSWGSMKARFND